MAYLALHCLTLRPRMALVKIERPTFV